LLLKMQQQYVAPAPKTSTPLLHGYRAKGSKSLLKARIEKIMLQPQSKSGYVELGIGLLLSLYIVISSSAFNFIDYEFKKIEVYQTLSNEHNSTGNVVFCKQCLSKEH